MIATPPLNRHIDNTAHVEAPNSGMNRARTQGRPNLGCLRRASWAFSTRRVLQGDWSTIPATGAPTAGDLVLARVDTIGHHDGLQLSNGRRKQLFVGDEIVVAYGNR